MARKSSRRLERLEHLEHLEHAGGQLVPARAARPDVLRRGEKQALARALNEARATRR